MTVLEQFRHPVYGSLLFLACLLGLLVGWRG